ncbi:MAG: hypothetical protein D6709_08045 [Chloroflexi bacterium]|jgi:cell division septal protein FtsQ|uniref:POTRA domain-containing protein n=1 Tax=Candidatus Thermofonsia Clade 3 bacterium TaxID=2364212 RepID=A0A2M8QDK6_9CHLR|nr:FtsQ-type POTRA domain-containing protein [Candidatus Roseilinea sp. NK_OTU-006]PJF47832.1 MAG: hypothetical protein CUN48_06520 [Candidatus Thermofonsia Clade 3 bacterium]RMG63578.1 MAG: hypothetical protein D6709_08045 [Chloroflexota bacterium]
MKEMLNYRPPRDRKPASWTRFDVALAQRAERRWARRSQTLAAVVCVAGAMLGAQWYSGESWRIGDITVQNNDGVPVEAIIGASGLQGEHFHFANLDAAAKAVDDLPGVEAASVTCRWEWRVQCVITVQPARPMALWQSRDGQVWNDLEGRVQVARADMPAQLFIRVEDGALPPPGSRLNPRLLRALNELIAAQPNVTRYAYSSQFGLMWVNDRKWRVRLGDAPYDGAMSDKLRLARALQQQLVDKGIEARVLDVRFVEAPYYIR